MLGFLRSASTTSKPDSVSPVRPNPSSSSDLSGDSLGKPETERHEPSETDESTRQSRLSEDGNVSDDSPHRNATDGSAIPQSSSTGSLSGSVLDAVRDQHPNLSVFRPSHGDRPPSGSNLQNDAVLPDRSATASEPTESPASHLTKAGWDSDSPSVRALQSKRVFLLKPKKRATLEQAEAQSEERPADGKAPGFLIQGLSSSSAVGSTSKVAALPSTERSGPSSEQTSTPVSSRAGTGSEALTPEPRSSTPQSHDSASDAFVRGILRRPRTPGTGSSVRFGKRLYDDGDESAMSASVENSPDQARTSGSSDRVQGAETDEERAARFDEEASVEWSLSIGGSPERSNLDRGPGSLTGSPHSQLSLSSLNDSPDHDQIRAIRDLSTSTEEDDLDDSSNSLDGSDSAALGRSRLPSSSPTVRIPMPRAMQPASNDSSSQLPESPDHDRSRALPSQVEPAIHHQRDASDSHLFGLSAALDEHDAEGSNLVDVSMDSIPRMDDTRSLSQIGRLHAAVSAREHDDRAREPKSSTESMPSSFGDYSSEPSFSESFLREAGAGMLAGLDLEVFDVPGASEAERSRSPRETPRPARYAELVPVEEAGRSAAVPVEGSTGLETVSGGEHEPVALRESTSPRSARTAEVVEQERTVVPGPCSSASTSPDKHSDFSVPVHEADPSGTASPPGNGRDDAGFLAILPSPRTPLTASKRLAHDTPGEVSLATTAADWATPQWSGPDPSPPSVNDNERSLDRSLSSASVSASSPTRERLARKVGQRGWESRSDRHMVLRPGKLAASALIGGSPSHDDDDDEARDRFVCPPDPAILELDKVVAVIRQLDQAHTERGSYLVNQVEQAEAKFTLLSRALVQQTAETERLARHNAVARDEVESLQARIGAIMQDFEASQRRNREKDDEVANLLVKLNGQLRRREGENEWRSRAEALAVQLEEEKRARWSERQDWEVRLSSMQRQLHPVAHRDDAASHPSVSLPASNADLAEAERQRIVVETREQTRDSCRRDFEIRTEIAQQQSREEIGRLNALVAELGTRAKRAEDAGRRDAERAHAEVGPLRDEVGRLTQQLGEEIGRHGEELSRLEERLDESRRENGRLERELADCKERAAAVEVQKTELGGRVQDAVAESERYRHQLALAEESLDRVRNELGEVQNAVRRRDDENEALRAELERASAVHDEALERKHADVANEAERLRADCRSSATLAEQAQAERSRIQAMLERAQEQREEDLEALAKLRLELDEAGRDKEDMLVSLTELERLGAEEQARQGEMREEVQRLTSERDGLLTELKQAEAIHDDRLRQMAAQLDSISVELEASRAQVEASCNDLAAMDPLREELERLRARVAMLEHEVADRGLTIVKLTKAKEVIEDENATYAIALSAKQLELSLLKRNARIALGEAGTPRAATVDRDRGAVSGSERTGATATATTIGAQRSVLGALSSNALAPNTSRGTDGSLARPDKPPRKDAKPDDEAGETITLQRGPAALKGTRRRTLDPTTVIHVGRLRPKPSLSGIATPPPPPVQPETTNPTDGTAMPPPSSSRPLTRRAPTVRQSTADPPSTASISAATRARIDRRRQSAAVAPSSTASSRAPSPSPAGMSSVAAPLRRSSVSSQRTLPSESESESNPVRRGPPAAADAALPTTEAATPLLSADQRPELGGSNPASARGSSRRQSTIHRRLIAVPAPPTSVETGNEPDTLSTPQAGAGPHSTTPSLPVRQPVAA